MVNWCMFATAVLSSVLSFLSCPCVGVVGAPLSHFLLLPYGEVGVRKVGVVETED